MQEREAIGCYVIKRKRQVSYGLAHKARSKGSRAAATLAEAFAALSRIEAVRITRSQPRA